MESSVQQIDSNAFRKSEGSLDKFLKELGVPQYLELFKANHIDETLILEVGDIDLERIGIASLGHRKMLLSRLGEIRQSAAEKALRKSSAKAGRWGLMRFVLMSAALLVLGYLVGSGIAPMLERNSPPTSPSDPRIFATMVSVFAWGFFLPANIAGARGHPRGTAIFLANLFFGGTGAGWLICFFWSLGRINSAEAGTIGALAAATGRMRR